MIALSNIAIHFGGFYLFDDATFHVSERNRIGLVGKNGTGKTTLLNIIAGTQQPETGNVAITGEVSIGFLPQEMTPESGKTVYDEALTAFEELTSLEKKIAEYTEALAERTDYESSEYHKLTQRLADANDRFSLAGGHNREATVEKILKGLGFEQNDFNRPLTEFSSGWQMRVELAKILLSQPDLILLDEPTNHLDIESIQWLEEYLINYPGAVVLVSHDRTFLDNITNKTVEIDLGKVYVYKAGYSEYVQMREERIATQQAALDNQQKEVRQIERFIERFRYKNTKAKQVQSRITMLKKMEDVEIEERDQSAIHFTFPPAPRSGKVVVEARNLSKAYGDHQVLSGINFTALRGERLAFVGKNGEGKSTLSKIITGNLDYTGDLNIGHNVMIGYYAQNQAELLNPHKTVFQTIDDIAVGDIRPRIRTILGSFLFGGEDAEKKVKVLSGGEKSRLALARLLLTSNNLLVLDEPTNHLDMASKDVLKNALLQYNGTLIIVSHDRDFLQGLTDKVFEFRHKKVKEYIGDVSEYLRDRKMADLKELEQNKKQQQDREAGEGPSSNKLRYEQKKELEREVRKISRRIEEAEENIDRMEKELHEKNQILSDPVTYGARINDEFYREYDRMKKAHAAEMERWEQLQIDLENKQKNSALL